MERLRDLDRWALRPDPNPRTMWLGLAGMITVGVVLLFVLAQRLTFSQLLPSILSAIAFTAVPVIRFRRSFRRRR